MANTNIDTLTVEIEASSTKAAQQINKTTESLKNLQAQLNKQYNNPVKGLSSGGDVNKLANDLIRTDNTIKRVTKSLEKLRELAKSTKDSTVGNEVRGTMKQYESILGQLKERRAAILSGLNGKSPAGGGEEKPDFSGANVAPFKATLFSPWIESVKALKSEMKAFGADKGLKAIADGFKLIGNAAKLAWSGVKKVASVLGTIGKVSMTPFTRMGNAIKNATKSVKGFVSSLGRIAMYRLLRSVIKAITSAFKEGLENSYAFSKQIEGEGHRFADALDSMTSASLTMKNQLGSAFAGLLAAIAPILNAIIALVTKVADAMSQLFSAFTGGTYLKANNVSKDFADTMKKGGGAAKEWKNQLMGFDVINRLEEPNKGGGGGGATTDPSSMFTDSPIAENIQRFVADLKSAVAAGDWNGVGKLIGDKINELLPTKEQWQSWGRSLGYALNGAVSSLFSLINTIDFEGLGARLAAFINGGLEKIDASTWGATLVRIFTIGIDFLIGFLQELDWGQVGQKVGDFLRGAFDNASEWLNSKDWSQIGTDMWEKFKELIEGIDFESLAESAFTYLGSAFRAVTEFLDNFLAEAWEQIKEYFRKKTEECGGDAWEGFKKGIVDAVTNVAQWVNDHIVQPFIDAFKKPLEISSPSRVFEGFGKDIIQGLWNGIEEKWKGFLGFFEGLWNKLKGWWDGLQLGAFHIPVPHFEWTYTQASGLIQRALEFVGLPPTIPHLNISWYANGGFPEDGLFMANHGELVGQFSNGRTAVANNEQITDGIAKAVYEAFTSAFAATGGSNNEREIAIYMDGKEIARTTTKYQKQFARANG